MDYKLSINNIYNHLENGNVDKAVMSCLRLARNLQDYLFAAIFLREMYPGEKEFMRILYDDTNHLKKDVIKFIQERSFEYWADTHTLDFDFGVTGNGEKKNLFAISVGELDSEVEQLEQSIQDMRVPPGMGEFDTAAFTDRYTNHKAKIRLRIKAVRQVKDKIKTRCLNYAIRIERQLQAQQKSQNFLEQTYNEVNNYFKPNSENVYSKLQKAAQLIDTNSAEDLSLLLTQVRRAIKAAADYFYPPRDQIVKCADGKERLLDDNNYLNRLHEFLSTKLHQSTSRDLLRTELDHLAVFARKLNDAASKGVHADVSSQEANYLVFICFFTISVCSYKPKNLNDYQPPPLGERSQE